MYNENELNEKVHALRQMKKEAEDLAAKIKSIEDELKTEMTERGVDELSGDDWKITWKVVGSNRLDQSAFKTLYPDLYESLKTYSESRRFLLG